MPKKIKVTNEVVQLNISLPQQGVSLLKMDW